MKLHKTRFEDKDQKLKYCKVTHGLWRFCVVDGSGEHVVGPFYTTKDELLSDLNNYATNVWGFDA